MESNTRKQYTNKVITSLRKWKKKLGTNESVDNLLAELVEILKDEFKKEYLNDNNFWLTRPHSQPPAHLAAFFSRWDVLYELLIFDGGAHVNPYHTNKYGETLIDVILSVNKSLMNPLAIKCYHIILDLKRHFCPNQCHGVLCVGSYCPKCKQTKVFNGVRVETNDMKMKIVAQPRNRNRRKNI